MHDRRVVPFDEVRFPAAAEQQLTQFFSRYAREHGGVGDLVAVQVQDGQDGAVGHRVQELVRMPRRGQRSGLGFAVADDTRGDESGIVEDGAERVAQRVPELAALVDAAWRLRRGVAWNAAGKRELPKQPLQPGFVAGDGRIDLRCRCLRGTYSRRPPDRRVPAPRCRSCRGRTR